MPSNPTIRSISRDKLFAILKSNELVQLFEDLLYNVETTLPTGVDAAVSKTTTVNGHPLSSNVTVTAADVGAPSGSGTSSGTNTGDQTITLTGDVTGTGTGSFAATVGNNAITYAKMQDVATPSTLIGRGDSGAGDPQPISLGTGLTMTGTTLSAAGGAGTGDVVGPASAVNNNVALFNGTTGKLIKDSGVAMNAAGVGLGSVTNDAQTKAAIVPNTIPSAGQIHAGNAGGTAFAAVSVSGDATLASTGALTVAAIGGKAVSLAGALTTSGAFASTFTMTGVTTVTFPTSGTLATVSGALGTPTSVTLTNATGLPIASGVSGLATGAATFLSSAAGFETMLANVSLGVAGTSLPSGTITAKKNLRIRVRLPGYAGSDTASFQFNGAAGTAYRYRWWFMAAGSVTPTAGLIAASTDRIKIASANTTNSRVVECIIENDPNVTEKLVAFTKSVFGTGSAATQATDDSGNGAWISGAATQITSVNLISSSNMNIGTEMTIWGWD